MGETKRVGQWLVPTEHRVATFLGGVKLDLREATFSAGETVITVGAVMAGVDIVVDAYTHVVVEGVGIMGDFSQARDKVPAQITPDSPVVRVKGFALMARCHRRAQGDAGHRRSTVARGRTRVTAQIVHLRQGGVSVVVAPDPDGVPTMLHWGPDLGELTAEDLAGFASLHGPGRPHSALDVPRYLGVVPDQASGFSGRPALEGLRVGSTAAALRPALREWEWHSDAGTGPGGSTLVLDGADPEAGWQARVTLALTEAGLLRARTQVTNTAAGDLYLAGVHTVLPVGAHATELLDLTGRWCKERTPQRHPWVQGAFVRTGRRGRTGHDATLLMVAGTPGFGFGHGEVWGVHTAWSGNPTTYAERTPEGECLLGGGESLEPGEVVLAPGESYDSPWLLGSWSGSGLDAMSARLHAWLRSQSPRTRGERKVLVNTWEAVYFKHELGRVAALADAAAEVGVERFVLDDGWFRGRTHDHSALGDWTVDQARWPDGLHPLIEHVHALGMDFGLWVEPEMINLDSDLAHAHPEWILRGRPELPASWRHQQVLDLQCDQAYAYVRDSLLALLDEYDIAFLKWDHNRDLIDVAHDGTPAVHGQTLAFYRLLDELRAAYPELEIESCASGGGRVDAEVLTRTDRIWASDTIDAVERQHLQTWTSLLVPPELTGSHLGGPVAHTTGRSLTLGYRAATALLSHFGIEWDLTGLDDDGRAAVREWIELHKQIRPTLTTGALVHGDHPDPAVVVTGVVALSKQEAWFVVATVAATATQSPTSVRLPGLDPARRYQVSCVTPTQDQHSVDLATSWADGPGETTTGAVLGTAGVRLPALAPETAQVYRVRSVEAR